MSKAPELRTDRPLDTNPVRRARSKLGLSLYEIEKDSRVNYQTWFLSECGCYATVPPVILDYLEDAGFSSAWVESEYRKFIVRSRASFFLNYEPLLNSLEFSHRSGKDGGVHPLKVLYKELGLSRQGLAKELCVQPAVLYKLESGKQKALPKQVEDALLEVGMASQNVGVFKRRVLEWHR